MSRLPRRHAWPEGHFGWLVPVTIKHGIRCGELAFVGGQVHKDPAGRVLDPYDSKTQTRVVMGHLRRVYGELGLGLDDVVKLVAYYVDDGRTDETTLLSDIAAHLGATPGPAITLVPVPYLVYPGMLVEIEAVAMASATGERLPRIASAPRTVAGLPEAFSQALRSGQMIHVGEQTARDAAGGPPTGDVGAQADAAMARLAAVLGELGARLDDAVKLNIYYAGDASRATWQRAMQALGRHFRAPGPVVTALPLPGLPDGLLLKVDVVAMLGADGARLPRRAAAVPGHWDWGLPLPFSQGLRCGEMIFVSSQSAHDARGHVVHGGQLVPQTHTAMENVRRVLGALGATMDDVVKMNASFKSGGTAEEQNANLRVRTACFADPGPASTGISYPYLALDGLMMEVEVIAMR
jgi:enamine deaminase RidA (YjgF/YER057c/UK114 family)